MKFKKICLDVMKKIIVFIVLFTMLFSGKTVVLADYEKKFDIKGKTVELSENEINKMASIIYTYINDEVNIKGMEEYFLLPEKNDENYSNYLTRYNENGEEEYVTDENGNKLDVRAVYANLSGYSNGGVGGKVEDPYYSDFTNWVKNKMEDIVVNGFAVKKVEGREYVEIVDAKSTDEDVIVLVEPVDITTEEGKIKAIGRVMALQKSDIDIGGSGYRWKGDYLFSEIYGVAEKEIENGNLHAREDFTENAKQFSGIEDKYSNIEELTDEQLKQFDDEVEEFGRKKSWSYNFGNTDTAAGSIQQIIEAINIKITEKKLYGEVDGKVVNAHCYDAYLEWLNRSKRILSDEKKFEDTIPGKIISAIVQLVAVIGDAVDQTLAWFMYGLDEAGTWPSYNILIDEPDMPTKDSVMVNMGKMKDSIAYPHILYSPEEIFSGRHPITHKKIALLDINFINKGKASDYTSSGTYNDRNILRDTVITWYNALRILAIVGLLSVLIYTGIRIVLTANINSKAKYKQMIVDWVMALVILFSMHYIMSFTISVVDSINTLFLDKETGTYSIVVGAEEEGENEEEEGEVVRFKTNLMGVVRFGVRKESLGEQFMYLLLYFALVAFTVKFTYMYMKRVLRIVFLTLIAPLVALTYPIDKIGDGKAQGFNMWLKEYAFNCLLQPVHFLLYKVLVMSAIDIAAANPIYAILVLGFMTQGESMLRQIFGFNRGGGNVAGLSTAGAIATGAAAGKALNKIDKVVNRFTKDKKEEDLKDMDKPGNMNAEDVDYGAFGPENSSGDSSNGGNVRRSSNPLENGEQEEPGNSGGNGQSGNGPGGNGEQRENGDGANRTRTQESNQPENTNRTNNNETGERKNPFANLVQNIAEKPKKTSKAIMEKAGMKIKKAKNTKERIKYGLTHKKEVMRKLTLKGKHKLGRKIGWDKSKGRGYNFARLAAKTAAAGARLTAKVGVGAAVTAAMMGASLADGKPNPFRSLGAGLLAAKTSGKLMKKGEKLTGRAIKGVENLKREVKYGERRAYQMKYIDKMRNDEALYQKFVKKYGIEKADEMMQRMFQNFTGIVDFSDVKKGIAYSDKLSQRDVKKELSKFRSRAEQMKKDNWEREVVEQKVVKDADGNDRLVEVTKKDKAEEMARDKKISYEDAVNKMKIEEYRNKENIDASESDESVEKKMKAAEKAQAEKEEAKYKKGVADKVRAQTGNSKLTDDEAMLLKYRDKNDDIARKTIQGRAMIKDEDSRALYDDEERQSYIQQKLEDAGSPEERRQRKYYYDSLFRNIRQFDETVNR